MLLSLLVSCLLMDTLHIQQLPAWDLDYNLEEATAAVNEQQIAFFDIKCLNWPDSYPYSPSVKARLAYNSQAIYIEYVVEEQAVLARFEDDATAHCWEDSCVEFFLIPNLADSLYYNLEFNAIATLHMNVGLSSKNRVPVDSQLKASIERYSSLGRKAIGLINEPCHWELRALIPWNVFENASAPVPGAQMRGNFYKCGDSLPVPHFLSWSPIPVPKPAFHRPEYFGTLIFD